MPQSRVILSVQGMACDGCTANVKRALGRVGGVTTVRVTLDPPQAAIEYDSEVVSPADLAAATADVGYPSTPLPAVGERPAAREGGSR
jgi:copper chaperone CopZ